MCTQFKAPAPAYRLLAYSVLTKNNPFFLLLVVYHEKSHEPASLQSLLKKPLSVPLVRGSEIKRLIDNRRIQTR